MIPNDTNISKSYDTAIKARNNLLHMTTHKKRRKVIHTFQAKVCCLCDKLIPCGEEKFISRETFHSEAFVQSFHFDYIDWSNTIGEVAKESIKEDLNQQYTQKCISSVTGQNKAFGNYLNGFILSPRSYMVFKNVKKKKVPHLGACLECYNSVRIIEDPRTINPCLPPHAIVNGLMSGYAPNVLKSLNPVELALVAKARVNMHLFQYTAGAHKAIRGYHTLYYSNPEQTNRVMNYYHSYSANENSSSELTFQGFVQVVLVGPFTPDQVAITKKQTEVNVDKVKRALRWLKDNNILYKDDVIDDIEISVPAIIDCSETVASKDSNVEKTIETRAVFPDVSNPSSQNGGFETCEQFKAHSMDVLANGKHTLIGQAPNQILKDYEDDNLLKAFPLLFPYGIGNTHPDGYGRKRNDAKFYEHLASRSSPDFQTAEFLTVLHNIFERKKMMVAAHTRISKDQKIDIANLSAEDLDDGIDRYLRKKDGSGAADTFVKKIKTITSSMGHTGEAAKKARSKFFAMLLHFGLPAVMFTITPEDGYNFRIQIMASELGQSNPTIPKTTDPDEDLFCFAEDCAFVRQKYPGLCAIDFSNVIEITIRDLLGWKDGKNDKTKGLFGDLDAFAYCVEEQGRKTLHAHFLLWIQNWKQYREGLFKQQTKAKCEEAVTSFASKVMCTKLHGWDCLSRDNEELLVPKCFHCGLNMKICTNQDLRELRTKHGVTSLGNKNIVYCSTCDAGYSSDDLAKHKLLLKIPMTSSSSTGQEGLRYAAEHQQDYDEQPPPLLRTDSLWSSVHVKSRLQICMEAFLMAQYVEAMRGKKIRYRSQEYNDTNFVTACLRNLHKETHVKTCFKKSHECRMKIPTIPSLIPCLNFDDEPTDWPSWTGNNETRRLFSYQQARKHEDCMVNVYNEIASNVFSCNSNVIAALSAAGIMYMTNYVSKSTNVEDTEEYCKAGRHMLHVVDKKYGTSVNAGTTTAGEEDDDQPSCDLDLCRKAVHALMGTVVMCTKSHIVSGPMASFLLRHKGSRFHFSHDFAYVNVSSFSKTHIDDIVLTSTEDALTKQNIPFLKSNVANYLCRSSDLEDVCVYDFYSSYTTTRGTKSKKKKTMEWLIPHPSKNYLKLTSRNNPSIPIVGFYEFPNAKNFEGISVIDNQGTISQCNENNIRQIAIEKLAKTAMTLFVPFRNATDLQTNGQYYPKFRHMIQHNMIEKRHIQILQNAQDCHNSFHAGRPKDPLERITQLPTCNSENKDHQGTATTTTCSGDGDDHYNDYLSALHELYVDNMDNIVDSNQISFTDKNNKMYIDSSVITFGGYHNCGKRLLITPQPSQQSQAVLCEPPLLKANTSPPINSLSTTTISNTNSLLQQQQEQEETLVVQVKTPSNLSRSVLYMALHRQNSVIINQSPGGQSFDDTQFQCTGSLENIQLYAQHCFQGDKDQEHAFTQIVAAFVLKLHTKCKPFQTNSDDEHIIMRTSNGSRIPIRNNPKISDLKRTMNSSNQFIGFLSGAGGTGKSKVISSVCRYCRNLCENQLNLEFNRRTIVVTAMTGSAAVNINGETTHKACCLNKKLENVTKDEAWANDTCLLIIDEISFASTENLDKLNDCLNRLCDTPVLSSSFGNLPILFAGDFRQLKPVGGKSLMMSTNDPIFRNKITTFLELNTNHRFHRDPDWGKLLQNMRINGPTKEHVDIVNSKIIEPWNEHKLPPNTVYATYTNKDRCAINAGIFANLLKTYYLTRQQEHHEGTPSTTCTNTTTTRIKIPDHILVIKASGLKLKINNTKKYRDMPDFQKNCLWTGCSDADVVELGGGTNGAGASLRIDPLLKLYVGQPVMINKNIDVEKSIANGSMCTFKCAYLKSEYLHNYCDYVINIDGYLVRCIDADKISYVELILQEGGSDNKILKVKPVVSTARASFPCPTVFDSRISTDTPRMDKMIQITQFPFNIANARTVHKLQGRSIDNLLVSTWSYTSNWIYVVLSRLRTSQGLYVRVPLNYDKCTKPEQAKDIKQINHFHEYCRRNKRPRFFY